MIEKANYEVDLHSHTVRSDGNDTPEELVEHAAARGVKILALTDHDIKPPETIDEDGKPVRITDYAKVRGLDLIPGIEISCETDISDCHIVGLGCDWNDAYFDEVNEFTIMSKVTGYKKLVEALADDGMDITWDEVISSQGEGATERNVQKKHIFNLMSKKGRGKTWAEAKLLVKRTPKYSIARKKPSAVSAITNINRTGGIAICAHPFLMNDTMMIDGKHMSRLDFLEYLFDNGLAGVEGRYTYDKTSYDGDLSKEEIFDFVTQHFDRPGVIISGGSDYHDDAKKGVENMRDIGECGLTMEEFRRYPRLAGLVKGENK